MNAGWRGMVISLDFGIIPLFVYLYLPYISIFYYNTESFGTCSVLCTQNLAYETNLQQQLTHIFRKMHRYNLKFVVLNYDSQLYLLRSDPEKQ